MMSQNLIECKGVSRTFGRGRSAVVAVHDAACSVAAGDQIALVGPSGSGKSTLLHILAGLDQPTSGTIAWPAFGRASLRPGPVGVVFQAPSLLPALNVLENVALPLVLIGSRNDDANAAALNALETLGLRGIANKLPDELSGGQAQRVSIARVLAGRPQLLLADEPTGQLDHETARLVVDALLATAEFSNAALIISTHDIEVAQRCATQWQVADGRLHANFQELTS